MKGNLHLFDKLIRVFISILLFAYMLHLTGEIVLKMVCGILAIYLTTTAAMGFCPLYLFLDINTKSGTKNQY